MSEKGLARLRRSAVGFVFQAFHLMDELTAQENVELPALLAGRSPRAARRRARELLDQVGLADRAATCLRRFLAASVSASPSPGHLSTSRSSSSLTSPPAIWTAPPP